MKRSVTLSDVLLPACPGYDARKHHHVHHLRHKAQGKDEYNDGLKGVQPVIRSLSFFFDSEQAVFREGNREGKNAKMQKSKIFFVENGKMENVEINFCISAILHLPFLVSFSVQQNLCFYTYVNSVP